MTAIIILVLCGHYVPVLIAVNGMAEMSGAGPRPNSLTIILITLCNSIFSVVHIILHGKPRFMGHSVRGLHPYGAQEAVHMMEQNLHTE